MTPTTISKLQSVVIRRQPRSNRWRARRAKNVLTLPHKLLRTSGFFKVHIVRAKKYHRKLGWGSSVSAKIHVSICLTSEIIEHHLTKDDKFDNEK
ncbi:hypothetical protein RRG08_050738 [Elysia crispata]|uniref:Uncharacterized protein n=1 Tax=Elysia crispata TaxID=231223 RepID=A0AAE0ZSH8_9GAST|nr:hypothetical protein RRG08_050738 [Elysia crispata]